MRWTDTVRIQLSFKKRHMSEDANPSYDAFYEFAADIDAFYRARYRYKRRCAFARYPTVDVRRAALNLYLRFNVGQRSDEASIVIARIGFQKQRRCEGTALLAKLVELAPRYGYVTVEIEQTGPDLSIQNFVRKFGFRNSFDERNWIVSIEELGSRLR